MTSSFPVKLVKRTLILLLLIYSGCYHAKEQSGSAIADNPTGMAPVLSPAVVKNSDIVNRESVSDFYAGRRFKSFWNDSTGRLPLTDSLVDFIRRSNRLGLNPADYHLLQITNLLTDTLPGATAYADVLLTDAFLSLYHDIGQGRLDRATLERVNRSSVPDRNALVALENIGTHSLTAQLESREPTAAQYRALKAALASFQLLANDDARQRERVEKISLNMERWRWQNVWPERYVLVNIPAFQLKVIEDDSVWLKSRVIVGKRETPTPVMESVIRSFIIYPYWHAPESIAIQEILPELQEDRSYLEAHNFEVLNKRGAVIRADTIQWDMYGKDYFPFILRQREGSENSMGIIKFNFANPYGVYLHDTNSKRLFRREKRDISHGCVRVSEAIALAHYLVREDDIYVSPEDLDQYLSLQQRLEIDLRKPIPVKLEYFTCEVEKGVPYFYDDIYRKDSLMLQSLGAPPLPLTGDGGSF
jgi:murein L,D-transpeptidase YcbB/YkuD